MLLRILSGLQPNETANTFREPYSIANNFSYREIKVRNVSKILTLAHSDTNQCLFKNIMRDECP